MREEKKGRPAWEKKRKEEKKYSDYFIYIFVYCEKLFYLILYQNSSNFTSKAIQLTEVYKIQFTSEAELCFGARKFLVFFDPSTLGSTGWLDIYPEQPEQFIN